MLLSRSIFDLLRVIFSPAPALAPAPLKTRLSTIKKNFFFNDGPPSLLEKNHLVLSICFLISIFSVFDQTKTISFRISSVLSKVEPEPGAGPSHRLQLRPKSTGSATLDKLLIICILLVSMLCGCRDGLLKFPALFLDFISDLHFQVLRSEGCQPSCT